MLDVRDEAAVGALLSSSRSWSPTGVSGFSNNPAVTAVQRLMTCTDAGRLWAEFVSAAPMFLIPTQEWLITQVSAAGNHGDESPSAKW